MLGISTCWWTQKNRSVDSIFRDIRHMGLGGVELEYRISESLYLEMKPRLDREVEILSVHNFFPRPDNREGGGDLFLLSSTDGEERARAVKCTIRTMACAQELGAGIVVLHLGRVDMPDYRIPLTRHRKQTDTGKGLSPVLTGEQRRTRKKRGIMHLDAVLSSLEKLNREAEKRGILLGIENRYHFHEIPDFEELGIILRTFEGGHIRYWHDVGHAQVQENQGILDQKDLLEAYGDKLTGVHIHDAKGLDDHLAPGQGEVNYEELWPLLKSSPIKVLEVHARVDRKDLMAGIQLVRGLEIS